MLHGSFFENVAVGLTTPLCRSIESAAQFFIDSGFYECCPARSCLLIFFTKEHNGTFSVPHARSQFEGLCGLRSHARHRIVRLFEDFPSVETSWFTVTLRVWLPGILS